MPRSKPAKTNELDDEIGFKLRLAQLALFSDFNRVLKGFDLRPVDFSSLLIIEAHLGVRQHVIGDRLKISRPNIVALVDVLATADLVERVVDSKDRRANQLRLTPNGVEVLQKVKAAKKEHDARVIQALDGVDLDNFVKGLDGLARLSGE